MSISGIFLESPETYDYQNDVVIRLTDPTFTVHQMDILDRCKEGDRITVREKSYRIREINPLGHGRMELRLINDKLRSYEKESKTGLL